MFKFLQGHKVVLWNVFSKSNTLLGVIEACSKHDAEVLADNAFPSNVKPIHVELKVGG